MATGNNGTKQNGKHVFPMMKKDSVTKESNQKNGPENRATLYKKLTENGENQFSKRTDIEVGQCSKRTEKEDNQRTNLSNTALDSKIEHRSNPSIKPADDFDNPFKLADDTSDLRLIVEGRPLYVSKVVLTLISPVFKRLFRQKENENMVELPLPGKECTDVIQFLSCVYPDRLAPLTDKNVEVVLLLAEEYEVHRLVEKCEDFMIKDIEITAASSPHTEKVVRYLYLAEKFGLEALQKVAFDTAATMHSDSLENVREFWELPPVTTTNVFIRRLKLLETIGKTIMKKIKETRNHCALYHKHDAEHDVTVCLKCCASIGKLVMVEFKHF
ncbi:BTB and MATH domain-containing protein 36-like [Dreissena polymorpha]|uniref:BTB domain-containing protein n=1 Tax=Dreissena polymorpha TaxID=45954 RepID=A0A9D4DPQ5_DREPO|nr:BTB and MATH domain-containing protein 36-like [Dreissena polymorpha]KAH3753587.1 hypothetical protein DPMN_188227 [Dreissena polymorpha]